MVAHRLKSADGPMPTAPSDVAQDLAAEVEALAALDLNALRSRWRQRLRTAPPASLPRPLLLRLLAYKLQARVHGDLHVETAAILDRLARDHGHDNAERGYQAGHCEVAQGRRDGRARVQGRRHGLPGRPRQAPGEAA